MDEQEDTTFNLDDSIDQAVGSIPEEELQKTDLNVDEYAAKVQTKFITNKVRSAITTVLKQNDALKRIASVEPKSSLDRTHQKDVDLVDGILKLGFDDPEFEKKAFNRIEKYQGTMSRAMIDSVSSALVGGSPEQQLRAAKFIDTVNSKFTFATRRLSKDITERANVLTIMATGDIPPSQAIEKANELQRPLTINMREGLRDQIRDNKYLDRKNVQSKITDVLGDFSGEAAAEYDKAYRAFFRGSDKEASDMATKVVKAQFQRSAFGDPSNPVMPESPENFVQSFGISSQDSVKYLQKDFNQALTSIAPDLKQFGIEGDDLAESNKVFLAPIRGTSELSGEFMIMVKDPETGVSRPLYGKNNKRLTYSIDIANINSQASQAKSEKLASAVAENKAFKLKETEKRLTPTTGADVVKKSAAQDWNYTFQNTLTNMGD